MKLWPFQEQAVRSLLDALREHRSALLVLPTGCGKTIVMADIVRRAFERGRRVLLLAPRTELLEQSRDKFIRAASGLRVELEQADSRVNVADLPDVVVASIQSMQRPERLARFPADTFHLLLVDESHHAVSDGHRRIIDHFSSAKVIGATATADRLDGTPLGEIFEVAAFTYDIRQAIADGWLVPVLQKRVQVASLDLSRVHTVAGDLNAGELEVELTQAAVLAETAGPLVELAGTRRTIVFAVSVRQAHALADVVRSLARTAEAIDGTTPKDERKDLLRRFATGDVQFLVNVAVLTEGYDCQSIECVAIARPTKSRALYTQMVGRGLRLSPDTGKRDCLVLDFVGNSGRHRLVNSLDVLAGSEVDQHTRAAAEQLIERDSELTAHLALERAAAIAAERAKRVQYETLVVDPFAVVALGLEWSDVSGNGEHATDRQVETLKSAGIKAEWHRLTRHAATRLIDAMVQRRARGLCTLKQAAQLGKRGLNPDVSFDDARLALDAIAANQWRTPGWLLRDPRFTPAGAQ